jgi:hypothetical protein
MASLSSLRVAKKYAPEKDGAKKFARRYGDSLICVRHRHNELGTIRYTTVELLVEQTPIASRAGSMVALRLGATEKSLRSLLLASGAKWNNASRQWIVPRRVAKSLGILNRIVPMRG